MDNLLLEKLEELTSELEKCPKIREMLELKKKIYEDNNLSNLLKKYRSLDKYDPNIVNVKKEIISNSLVMRYKELENELYFIVLEANKRLNTLVNKKGCSNENN